jgi:hypothetical protein
LFEGGQIVTASVFADKSKEPTSSELDEALGETATLLRAIEQHLLDQFGELIPQTGFFTVVFTLGKRAVLASEGTNLPEEILSAIETARQYAEGRSVRFDVTSREDAAIVKQLVAIKMSN